MIIRSIVLLAGLSGAFGAAQFPAYSQQYMQRLGGAVDALEQVVTDFDTSAATLGLTRDQALSQMRGTAFVEARKADMERTFERHLRLSADFQALSGLGPFMRAYNMTRLTDPEIAKGAWQDFEPALPLTSASGIFAAFGFAMTGLSVGCLAALLRRRRPLRRAPMPA